MAPEFIFILYLFLLAVSDSVVLMDALNSLVDSIYVLKNELTEQVTNNVFVIFSCYN